MSVLWSVVTVYAAVVGWAVVLIHSRRPWWRTGVGVNLVGLGVSLALIFTLLALGSLIGPLGLWVWVGAASTIAALLTQRLILLVRIILREPTEHGGRDD